MDELDRLFHCVVRAVRDARPDQVSGALEVAELIALVPYKVVRAELGVDTNEDFAHALTRLLSGERGYLFVDDLMQDDLRAELKAPNPDLLAYRAYLNARVTLSQEHTKRALEKMGSPALVPRSTPPKSPVAPAAEPAAPASAQGAPPQSREPLVARPPSPSPRREPPTGPRASRPVSMPRPLDFDLDPVTAPSAGRPGCKYCGHTLPQGRDVRFCPSCGQNLLVRRCAACSAELEEGWKFCVACGRAAES